MRISQAVLAYCLIILIYLVRGVPTIAQSGTITNPSTISVTMFLLDPDGASLGVKCAKTRSGFGCVAEQKGNVAYPYPTNPAVVRLEEDYLLDVVSKEMDPEKGYADEAYRVQAIAARTFVLWRLNNGMLIDNSTNTQIFLPRWFDRLGLKGDEKLTIPFPVDKDPCSASKPVAPNTLQQKICAAVKEKVYISSNDIAPIHARYGADPKAYTTTSSNQRATVDGGETYLRSVPDPISNRCHDTKTFGQGIGMQQQSSSRWLLGSDCGTSQPGARFWSVKWKTAEQVLFHYYTGVTLLGSSTQTTVAELKDDRWNLLSVNVPVTKEILSFNRGAMSPVVIRFQNTGITTIGCNFRLTYKWQPKNGAAATIGESNSLCNNYGIVSLAPGDAATIELNMVYPPNPGAYTLTFDMEKSGTSIATKRMPVYERLACVDVCYSNLPLIAVNRRTSSTSSLPPSTIHPR